MALLAACTDGDGVRITATSGSSGRPTGDSPTTTASTAPGTATPPSSAHATTTAPPTAESATGTAGSLGRSGAVNALLIGSDSRTSSLRRGNSDVITVVQLTADRQRLNLVSVARDTVATYATGGRGKINAAYVRGGPEALANAVSRVLGGLTITYVVQTGFDRFIRISELLGGFTVQNRVTSNSSGPQFPSGPLTLKGQLALTYVRERKGLPNGDLDRTERHRAALTGMLLKLQQLLRKDEQRVMQLIPQLLGQVVSDKFSAADAQALMPVVRRITRAEITSVMVPIARFGMVGGSSVDIINEARNAELIKALAVGDLSAYVARYGTSNAPTG